MEVGRGWIVWRLGEEGWLGKPTCNLRVGQEKDGYQRRPFFLFQVNWFLPAREVVNLQGSH